MNPLATINIIIQYEGSGFILLLYAAAFVLLLKNETDRGNRVLFGYLPLALCVLFLLPPVHGIYSKIEGSDTYYRLFWLLPAGTTIVYAGRAHICRPSPAHADSDGVSDLSVRQQCL